MDRGDPPPLGGGSAPARDPAGIPAILEDIYSRLFQEYGPQHWWPGDGPLDVVIGAILTQSAAWTNVEMALDNLKEAGCRSLDAIHRKRQDDLAAIIRPSGYFNAKARKLKAFASHVASNHAGDLGRLLALDLAPLREELLSIHGIGPETADDIILYAADKPSFVIDSYTRRIVARLGIGPQEKADTYDSHQALFQDHLAPDTGMFNEYHALLDRHAKETCGKVPSCSRCCLLELCATGLAGVPTVSIDIKPSR